MTIKSANLLTVKETAEYLRIPVPTVYYLVQREQLPAVQIGGRWRIKKELLDQNILKLNSNHQPPKARILVVDDQEDITNLLVLALSNKGHSAEVATGGQQALKRLQDSEYDLIFLDLNLPDVPGEEVFEKVTELKPNVHVVIMTGCSTVQSLEKILSLGPVTVLQKPFKLDQLFRIIDVVLGKF